MAVQKYTIYKYVKTSKGWRYSRAAIGNNGRLKSNVVFVNGQEETHPEGAYFLLNAGKWLAAGTIAAEALARQTRLVAGQEYERKTGEELPGTDETKGELLSKVIGDFIEHVEIQGVWTASRLSLSTNAQGSFRNGMKSETSASTQS